jgi:hypothetical protein
MREQILLLQKNCKKTDDKADCTCSQNNDDNSVPDAESNDDNSVPDAENFVEGEQSADLQTECPLGAYSKSVSLIFKHSPAQFPQY